MLSFRAIAVRQGGASISKQCIKLSSQSLSTKSSISSLKPIYITNLNWASTLRQTLPKHQKLICVSQYSRSASTSNAATADELIEEIQDQYATARDEFEIATEETEKNSTYAEEDRKAAREELDKLKGMFESAIGGVNGEEVKRRIGGRIRELDYAVVALEEKAQEHD